MNRKQGGTDAVDEQELLAVWKASRSATCARCGRVGTRVGLQNDTFVTDVLCHGCFERAPMRFKLTSAQDVYRDAIEAGAHPRIAARAAEVRGLFRWWQP